MSLQKMGRLMTDGQWTSLVEAACHLTGKPYDQEVLTAMTQVFEDQISFNPDTYEISVPNLDDTLIQAVEEYSPPAPSGPETMTDAELIGQIERLRAEQNRRADLVRALKVEPILADAYQAVVLDREPGSEYEPPLGYFDAYPKGWIVTHGGKEWEALRDGATGLPGESPDWKQIPGTDPETGDPEILDWVQPHAGSEYEIGVIVRHNGHLWENTVPRNGWEPGQPHSGWLDLGPVE